MALPPTVLAPWSAEQLAIELENHKPLLKAIGLEEDVFLGLDALSDLQFVITLAVIAEGATAKALQLHLNDQILTDWILKNVMQAKRLELSEKLGILESKNRHALRQLAEIRNKFAHRVENLSKPLNDFYADLTADEKKSMLSAFEFFLTSNKQGEYDDSRVIANFRNTLMTALMVPLYELTGFLAKRK